MAAAVPAAQASEDSPLVGRQEYFAGGVAVSWIFGDSSTRVRVDE